MRNSSCSLLQVIIFCCRRKHLTSAGRILFLSGIVEVMTQKSSQFPFPRHFHLPFFHSTFPSASCFRRWKGDGTLRPTLHPRWDRKCVPEELESSHSIAYNCTLSSGLPAGLFVAKVEGRCDGAGMAAAYGDGVVVTLKWWWSGGDAVVSMMLLVLWWLCWPGEIIPMKTSFW